MVPPHRGHVVTARFFGGAQTATLIPQAKHRAVRSTSPQSAPAALLSAFAVSSGVGDRAVFCEALSASVGGFAEWRRPWGSHSKHAHRRVPWAKVAEWRATPRAPQIAHSIIDGISAPRSGQAARPGWRASCALPRDVGGGLGPAVAVVLAEPQLR